MKCYCLAVSSQNSKIAAGPKRWQILKKFRMKVWEGWRRYWMVPFQFSIPATLSKFTFLTLPYEAVYLPYA